MSASRIRRTVGLWSTPVNRFRIFKVGTCCWHVVWPNDMFARRIVTTGDRALDVYRNALRGK